ncbi:thioredoxin family protein [Viridibacillus arvi]|uniref:thioredoxin family protein n=1 Tax=Viridibacillus arvi TaxID=263475 RepID=UPI0034CDC582
MVNKKIKKESNQSIPSKDNTNLYIFMSAVLFVLISILGVMMSINGKQNTVEPLDDPYYQNVIGTDTLDKKIQQEQSFYVLYFSPQCQYCESSKADIAAAFNDKNTELFQVNVLEFEKEEYAKYNIPGTPTIVYYVNGKEKSQVAGARTYEEYVQWIKDTKNDTSEK